MKSGINRVIPILYIPIIVLPVADCGCIALQSWRSETKHSNKTAILDKNDPQIALKSTDLIGLHSVEINMEMGSN